MTPAPSILRAMRDSGFAWDAARRVFRPMTPEEINPPPDSERVPGVTRGNLSAAEWEAECAAMEQAS